MAQRKTTTRKATAKPKAIPKALQAKVKKYNADMKKLNKLESEIKAGAKRAGYTVRYN